MTATPAPEIEIIPRALRSASRAMSLLAMALTAVAALPFYLRPASELWRGIVIGMVSLMAVLPGAVCLFLALALSQKKFWAVVVSLVLTCGDLLLLLLVGTGTAACMIAGLFPRDAWIAVVIPIVLALPFGIAIYHLTRAFEAMRPDGWSRDRRISTLDQSQCPHPALSRRTGRGSIR